MLYIKRVLLRCLEHSTLLVAVSEATKRDLLRFCKVPPDRVRVVKNGVDVSRFRPGGPDDLRVARVRKHFDVDSRYLLYPSRLEHPGKNHVRLLRGFSESGLAGSHKLLLVGKDWGAQDRIEREIGSLGLRDHVRLLGFVEGAMLPGLVAGADGVIMVGLHEGFGLPALEAITAGKPVCASDTGSLPEVVREFGTLCDPYDPTSIAKALRRVVDDETLRARTEQDGPSWGAQHTWDITADGLYDACQVARFS